MPGDNARKAAPATAMTGDCPTTTPDGLPVFPVLGVPITVTSLEQAAASVTQWAGDDKARFVFVRDIFGLMQAVDNPELFELHRHASMVTPDGMPLVWLGKLAKRPVSRTCGADLMDLLIRQSGTTGVRHYFYGGKPGIAEQLRDRFLERYPGAHIVGVDTPPFRPLTPDELAAAGKAMNDVNADVVWIGISSPKQEWLMRDLAPHVRSTMLGVGAAFDFHTGAVKRAPKWMQDNGLEWAWRLGSEPGRLWKRYLITAPRFVFRLARDGLKGS
jgi:N-acetylglucosaminyldiphosphoundecaprenol N-acetyl-beta-D-mannosaminyltransferase